MTDEELHAILKEVAAAPSQARWQCDTHHSNCNVTCIDGHWLTPDGHTITSGGQKVSGSILLDYTRVGRPITGNRFSVYVYRWERDYQEGDLVWVEGDTVDPVLAQLIGYFDDGKQATFEFL